MGDLILVVALVGQLSVTSYRSVPEQTDDSPYITSIGERVHPHGVAVSRDLLKRWGGPLDYGDLVFVEGYGFKVINDCMHERHRSAVDIWVATLEEERKIGTRKGRVWVVRPAPR